MHWKLNLGLSVLMLIYTLVGALVFYVLEHEKVAPVDISTLQFYQAFLNAHPNVTSTELVAFTRQVVQMTQQARDGVVVAENVTAEVNGWTYDNAVFFAITVVSTIGYGHITPRTVGGRWFCIFFALLGIPMAVALLASVGSKLRKVTDALHNATPWCRANRIRDRRFKSGVVLTLGTVFMLAIPALVFTYTEDWDYLTALYFSTITLTTVGFGDYVPGSGIRSNWFRLLLCVWLIVGLAYLALVISEASELYSGSKSKEEEEGDAQDKSEVPSGSHATLQANSKHGNDETFNIKL